ncbi:MAG TPA: sigma-70 family RNA polymerase sigma factor [Pirellulaceae bacterium]|nr:sigma-70 family RNA polymerase sigma factor [Pirellulaceae bacterium]
MSGVTSGHVAAYNVRMTVDSDRESSTPSKRANFATTHWSMVLEAGHRSSPDSDDALESLCTAYWYPLYAFVRRRGASSTDAKDLTQEFFAHLLEKQSLQAADPNRGRFRSFLLTAFKNFLSKQHHRHQAQKRGGDIKHLSIDFDSGEQRYQFEPADDWTPEKIYERRWALTLLDQVMVQLQQEYDGNEKADLFEQCKGHLTGAGSSYEEAANSLGVTEGALRVAVHRMRSRYRELLKAEVASTLEDPEIVDDELETLRRAIQGEQ